MVIDKQGEWDGEHCYRCKREQRIAWAVDDYTWNRIVLDPELRKKILCLECFLELAGEKADDMLTGHFSFLQIGGARFTDD
jgi:hypothetical protein